MFGEVWVFPGRLAILSFNEASFPLKSKWKHKFKKEIQNATCMTLESLQMIFNQELFGVLGRLRVLRLEGISVNASLAQIKHRKSKLSSKSRLERESVRKNHLTRLLRSIHISVVGCLVDIQVTPTLCVISHSSIPFE